MRRALLAIVITVISVIVCGSALGAQIAAVNNGSDASTGWAAAAVFVVAIGMSIAAWFFTSPYKGKKDNSRYCITFWTFFLVLFGVGAMYCIVLGPHQ
jgi:uncharacterized membrane protein